MVIRCLFLFTLLISLSAKTQIQVKGKVVDAESGTPLSYGTVKIKGTSKGVLTNQDGAFQLECTNSDTLLFKYLSYYTQYIPVTKFIQNPLCQLRPKENQLTTVVVSADKDFLYDLLIEARKKLRKMPDYSGKAYFMLETESKSQPVEQIECYYNATLDGSGVFDLGLKNGRIGMAEFESDYFVSLSTTDILCNYDLINSKSNSFPDNPLQLSKRKLKKKYDLVLIGLDRSRYKIKFSSKVGADLFDGELWLDADLNRILSIRLKNGDLKRHPYVALHESHKLDKINFDFTYFFDAASQKVDKIELKYLLDYNNSVEVRPVETSVIMLFYDYKKVPKVN